MMLYETNDGQKFYAKSPEELVGLLRAASMAPAIDDHRFMEETATRAKVQTGTAVDPDDPKAFVDGLIASGLLRVVEET